MDIPISVERRSVKATKAVEQH